MLASCGDDGTIRLWDPVTATPVGMPMKGHTSTIEDICVLPAPDGRTLLAGAGDDGTVAALGPGHRPARRPGSSPGMPAPSGACARCQAARPGQPVLVSAGSDGTVRLWDPATGQPAGPVITAPGAHPRRVRGTRCQAGQPPILASGGEDGTVRLWDLATGQPAGPATDRARRPGLERVRSTPPASQGILLSWPARKVTGRCGSGTSLPGSRRARL